MSESKVVDRRRRKRRKRNEVYQILEVRSIVLDFVSEAFVIGVTEVTVVPSPHQICTVW